MAIKASKQTELFLRTLEFIAWNDEPTWTTQEAVENMMTVQMAAYVFDVTAESIAESIISLRTKYRQ